MYFKGAHLSGAVLAAALAQKFHLNSSATPHFPLSESAFSGIPAWTYVQAYISPP
jgi:hypothetical protein